MAKYELTSPDGQTYEVNAPDNATETQVFNYFKTNLPKEQAQPQHQPEPQAPPQAPEQGGLMSDLSGRLETAQGYAQRKGGGTPLNTMFELPSIGVVAGGQGMLAAGDVAAAGLKGAYGLVPEERREMVSEGVKSIVDSPIGQMGMRAIQQGGEFYDLFKRSYPDAAVELESVGGLLGFGFGKSAATATGRGIGATAKEGANIVGDISRMSRKMSPDILDKRLSNTVEKNLWNAIRPTVAKKKSFSDIQKYMGKAKTAIKSIVTNKDNLNLTDEFGEAVAGVPKNLRHFSQAIESTKKTLFKQYDDMATAAGGGKIDFTDVAEELEKMGNSKKIFITNPNAKKYASDLADRLRSTPMTAGEAQDVITEMNRRLESFYSAPDYGATTTASMDALAANKMREVIDTAISKVSGEGYKDLKKQYGALKTLEKEVVQRAIVDARKNVKGLADFTDIFSGAEAMAAVATMNPAMLTKAATAKGIAKYTKMMNNPNTYVKKMFAEADKAVTEMGGFKPKSKLGGRVMSDLDRMEDARRAAKNPTPGFKGL